MESIPVSFQDKMKRRFREAHEKLGNNWKQKMASAYARYNTLEGATKMQRVQVGARKNGSVGIVALEEVTRDMERLIDDMERNPSMRV